MSQSASRKQQEKARYVPSPKGRTASRQSNNRITATRGSQGLTSRGLTAPRTRGSLYGTSQGTALTLGSTVMMRLQHVPRPLHRSALLTEMPRYLETTELEKNFREVLAELLERPDLPYNPYPGFHRRLRPFAEKFYMDAETREKVDQIVGRPLKETVIANLMTMKEGGGVWGLASLLPNVCPPVLLAYKWVVDDVTPPPGNLYTQPGYSNQAMVAIVGMTVFQGSLYAESHNLQLRFEYLVTGPEVKEGVSIFINSVMMDIDAMYNDRTHILIGVNVPYVTDDENDVWDTDYFDVERIQMEKGHFLQSLTNAVIGNKFIFAECVFRVDPNQSKFMRGQKQYSLNFIKVVEDEREEGLSTFSEFPMGTLHEGVFLTQTHAEAYISIFTPQMESAELQNIRIASAASEAPTRGRSGARRFSNAVEHDRLSILQYVHGRLDRVRPAKVRIDGFRLGDDPGHGPFSWQIISPIRTHHQRKVASCHPKTQLFDAIYSMLLLVFMDRASYSGKLLVELYRLLHGTAGRLFLILEQNMAIRALIRGFDTTDDIHLIRSFLTRYRQDIDELLASSLHDRSSDLRAIGWNMATSITDLLNVSDFTFGSASHVRMIVDKLRQQMHYAVTLMMQLAEDSLFWCPHVAELLETMQNTFPEEINRPETPERVTSGKTRARVSQSETFRHGQEDEAMLKHEYQVINVQRCMERDPSPKVMVVEAVLLRYVVDTHLDLIWSDFLSEIFLMPRLPPNPYPRLVTVLRQSAMSMDLCYEKSSTLEERMLAGTAQEVDRDNFIYQLPGCNAFGCASSMAFVDTGAYVPLSQIVHDSLLPTNYVMRKGPFRVGICTAFAGSTPLYGRLQPYLVEVELHEHIYIQGPPDCSDDGVQLFSKIVHSHAVQLIEKEAMPVLGVYMGEEQVRWPWEDILNKRQGFWTELQMCTARKEHCYLKLYMQVGEWRYVTVMKYFKFHYLDNDGLESTCFFPEDAVTFYQSVFLHKERAAFHYQNGGPPRGGNPLSGANVRTTFQTLDQQILTSVEHAQWLHVHRLLLLKSAMNKDTHHVVETWRMLHSVAAQAEYMVALLDSLQDLTMFAMERERWKGANLPRPTSGTPDEEEESPPLVDDEEEEEMKGPLQMRTFSRMTSACRSRLDELTSWDVTLGPDCLNEVIMDKWRLATERDTSTGQLFVQQTPEAISQLEEIKQMLTALRDALSADVHNQSPRAVAALKALRLELESRPSSVLSEQLDQPSRFKSRRPRANQRIVPDDLLYVPK